jgi:crotonyl-CoA carboxylase/reductase
LSRVFPFSGTAECHQLMRDNLHPSGNMAILVNAPTPGLRTLADVRAHT